jgi:hypothetical protein|tara:strand:- start:2913 stop:3092 length:180 start_codon:yes stop_codon:yes gene_type:complete
MQKKTLKERQEKIKIETPYGTIESDSGNHFLDIATIVVIILVCAILKIKGLMWLKKLMK